MSVLAEAISVVVPVGVVSTKYPGGMSGYRRDCPNRTFCADEYLTRIGFMDPRDVQSFVGSLQMKGLVFVVKGTAIDLVVVDQLRGPTVSCPWLSFERLPE